MARKKKEKVRTTVLLCSNSTGSHKLCPLVIGTSKKPQYFNKINISQLPVIYKNNKKAWMRKPRRRSRGRPRK
ncbi:10634_t:CDS:2, partial [Diversispora eburnea]